MSNRIRLKKNALYIIITLAVIVAVVVMALVYKRFSKEEYTDIPQEGVDLPLSPSNDEVIKVPEDVSIEYTDDIDKYYGSLIEDVSHVAYINNFLLENDRGDMVYTQGEAGYHSWELKEDYVQYTEIADEVIMSFEEAILLDNTVITLNTEEEIEQHFNKVMKSVLKQDYDYKILNIEDTDSSGYLIESSRLVNGLPVEQDGYYSYSDYIELDMFGGIVGAKIMMVEFGESFEVPLIDPVELGTYLDRGTYPYTYNEGKPIGYTPVTSGDLAGDAPEEFNYYTPSSGCVVQSIDIVYVYMSRYSEHIAPTYKLKCMSTVTGGGNPYSVPVVIYANAIDPEYVKIPE